jgi:hypothetical protein
MIAGGGKILLPALLDWIGLLCSTLLLFHWRISLFCSLGGMLFFSLLLRKAHWALEEFMDMFLFAEHTTFLLWRILTKMMMGKLGRM